MHSGFQNQVRNKKKKKFFFTPNKRKVIINFEEEFSKLKLNQYHSFILAFQNKNEFKQMKHLASYMKLNMNLPIFTIVYCGECLKNEIDYGDLLNFAFDIKAISIFILPKSYLEQRELVKNCIDQTILGATLKNRLKKTDDKSKKHCQIQ